MVIHLSPDLEKALADKASELGTTPELLAIESLRKQFAAGESVAKDDSTHCETMVDFLSGYVGVLHSSEHVPGGARMSENTGKKFAAGLLEKQRRTSR